MAGMALVGRIARAHGLRGLVVINVETDFPEARFRPGAQMFGQRGGPVGALTINTVRFQSGRPVIGFTGVDSIEDAEALAGVQLLVPIDQLAALPSDTFYRHDLIGCRVETLDGAAIGTAEDVQG